MSPRTPSADFTAGIRAAVTWLHAEAMRMNDPKARQILNDAAFHLGQDKPAYSSEAISTAPEVRVRPVEKMDLEQMTPEQHRECGCSACLRRLALLLPTSEPK